MSPRYRYYKQFTRPKLGIWVIALLIVWLIIMVGSNLIWDTLPLGALIVGGISWFAMLSAFSYMMWRDLIEGRKNDHYELHDMYGTKPDNHPDHIHDSRKYSRLLSLHSPDRVPGVNPPSPWPRNPDCPTSDLEFPDHPVIPSGDVLFDDSEYIDSDIRTQELSQ